MFRDGSIGERRFGAGPGCLFLNACMMFWSAGAGASSLHIMHKAALKFPALSFARTAAAMCWPSLFDVRRFLAVGVVSRDSFGLSLIQPVTRLLMMLLRFLLTPPRSGFVRMTGGEQKEFFTWRLTTRRFADPLKDVREMTSAGSPCSMWYAVDRPRWVAEHMRIDCGL